MASPSRAKRECETPVPHEPREDVCQFSLLLRKQSKGFLLPTSSSHLSQYLGPRGTYNHVDGHYSLQLVTDHVSVVGVSYYEV